MKKWRIEDSEELYNIKGWGVNYFGINKKEALDIEKDMITIIRENWRKIASKNGLSKSSIEYMKPAFAVTQI